MGISQVYLFTHLIMLSTTILWLIRLSFCTVATKTYIFNSEFFSQFRLKIYSFFRLEITIPLLTTFYHNDIKIILVAVIMQEFSITSV